MTLTKILESANASGPLECLIKRYLACPWEDGGFGEHLDWTKSGVKILLTRLQPEEKGYFIERTKKRLTGWWILIFFLYPVAGLVRLLDDGQLGVLIFNGQVTVGRFPRSVHE